MTELRPEEPDYASRLRRIREQLDEGLSVYVDHCEFGTSKKLVLVRATALTGAHFPPSFDDYVLVTWIYTGSFWYPLNTRPDAGYIQEKLAIPHCDDDARSIAALMSNIAKVGAEYSLHTTLVTAKELR